ncbi:gluconate 2-dehydrogenase subunit 3 family protein [Flavobacterium sp. W1B]|uniref:gluconate 2-dehydrogenase subunit 3 family protein n=1 Tax=Flavobacterium sp. W1B TaxID=3394146 RepID=UPI0039BD67AA
MDRRKALKNVAFLLGTAISSSTMGVLFENFGVYESEKNQVSFSATDEEILAEFADIIIPTTKSSLGAKAAGVGNFIPMMVRDCYPANLQQLFASGMKEMLAKCQKDFNKDFISLNAAERHKLMTDLTAEAIANGKKPSFFMITRDLTLLGYFSSEIGCTQAREYLPVPGRYDGNADYKPGQKAWAT